MLKTSFWGLKMSSSKTSLEDAKIIFQDRCDETDEFFDFLEIVLERRTKITKHDSSAFLMAPKLKKTLRANAILVLYNLIESTVRNFLHAVHVDMHENTIHVVNLIDSLKEKILKDFKKSMKNDYINRIIDINHDIILESFDIDKICSGNIDAREIKNITAKYKIQYPYTKGSETSNALLQIKTGRNTLAHGKKSFAEYANNLTIDELLTMKEHTITNLSKLATNTESYIEEQKYLAQPIQNEHAEENALQ